MSCSTVAPIFDISILTSVRIFASAMNFSTGQSALQNVIFDKKNDIKFSSTTTNFIQQDNVGYGMLFLKKMRYQIFFPIFSWKKRCPNFLK